MNDSFLRKEPLSVSLVRVSDSTQRSRTKLFLRILEAELKDLVEDIEMVERRQEESFARLRITPYVYKENSALLGKEHECLKSLLKRILAMRAADYPNCDDLAAAVMAEAKEFVAQYEFPESVVAFVERKIGKVRRYIEESGE